MQTLRPQSHETDAGMKGACAAEVTCNSSKTSTASHACAVETGRLRKVEQQSGNSDPSTAAHVIHHDAKALELWSPSPLGDELPMSGHPAPQDPPLMFQGHQLEVDTSRRLDENWHHHGELGAGPYERLRSCGAHEQLRALHQIDHLQRAGMERKMAEVSNEPFASALLIWPCLIMSQL